MDLVIQATTKKGRAFTSHCVAAIIADSIFAESGDADKAIRPVWAMFAGSEAETRPFIANLRLGRKAEPANSSRVSANERYEFLKSIGYSVAIQREVEGTITTLYHPELFRLDPGMVDPEGIRFILLVPEDWAAVQDVEPSPAIHHALKLGIKFDKVDLTTLVPAAYLFTAYLDRRTRCPLLADGRFSMQILLAALDQGLASFPGDGLRYARNSGEWGYNPKHGFRAERLERAGIQHAISFGATHEVFEAFLAEQVTRFFELAGDGQEFTNVSRLVDLSDFEQAG